MKRIIVFLGCLVFLLLTSCFEAKELNDYVLTVVDNGPLASNDHMHVITIESAGKFKNFYYTLDNSSPKSDSLKYIPAEYKCIDSKTYSGILVREGVTIKARAISGEENSFIAEKTVSFAYAVGDKGPAGGFIFYDCDADNESGNADGLISADCGWRYLEAAPNDFATSVPFGASGVVGTSDLLGEGKSNTEALVAAMGDGSYAAKTCSNYFLNGFDDWFLPSKQELNLMYENLQGKLSSNDYWSSSEKDSSYAWCQNSQTGKQTECDKSIAKRVRPVRAYTNSEKHTHSWDSGLVAKTPTCTVDGEITYTCTVCGKTMAKVITAKGTHTWDTGIDTLPATCNSEGKKTFTCTVCGETREESISATGVHTYVSYRCSGCGLWGKGPAGGYVFYDCDADNSSGNADNLVSTECGWRFLEAAPTNRSTRYGFGYNRLNDSDSNSVVGTSTAIGTGKANTESLVAVLKGSAYDLADGATKNAYAALVCYGFSWVNDNDEVFDDWFLPSLEELNLMYENLHKNGLGDFNYKEGNMYVYSYWSSSEYSETKAWYFIFSSNFNYKDVRQSSARSYYNVIRPIRAFSD